MPPQSGPFIFLYGILFLAVACVTQAAELPPAGSVHSLEDIGETADAAEHPNRLPSNASTPMTAERLRMLLRPSVAVRTEWEPLRDGFEFSRYDISAVFHTPPVFGPPPPSIKPRFSMALLDAPEAIDLPNKLYNLSIAFAWMRPINDKWVLRLGVSPSFASDFENTSGDAWRVRAQALAFYQHSPDWKFGIGAVATGRDDIPVFPGAGAIWTPAPSIKANLFFPRPQISYRVHESLDREAWVYLGGGLGGGTWAFERSNHTDDILTYRDWRLVAGAEFGPAGGSGLRPQPGLKGHVEAGFVFGRKLEFDTSVPDYEPNNTSFFSCGLSY
jgi:hypothetical protein